MADDFINGLGGGSPDSSGGGGTNAGTTADILRNQVLSELTTALKNAFPQATAAISHSASVGSDTLPANPAGFLTITVGSSSFKIPLYNL